MEEINPQPEIGLRLLAWRKEGPTAPVSRLEASEITGFNPQKINSIEKGRKLKAGEYEQLIQRIPEIAIEGHPTVTREAEAPPEDDSVVIEAKVDPVFLPMPRQVSNSEVQAFKRCRRKWWLTYHRKLKLKDRKPTGPLAIGTRVHLALATMYDPETAGRIDPFDVLERAVTEDWTAYKHALVASGAPEDPSTIVQFNKDIALERIMLEGYVKWLAETGADAGLTLVSAETYMEAPIDVPNRDNVTLIGKLDARVTRDTDGARLFIDHKTTQTFEVLERGLPMDEQMLHYHLLEWLADVEDGRCDGAIYNMIRKVKRGPTAVAPFYKRSEVHHNTDELNSYRARLSGVISDMLAVEDKLNSGEDLGMAVYPSPNRNCSWDCDFSRICHMFDDGSRVEDALEDMYTNSDPLAHYTSKE